MSGQEEGLVSKGMNAKFSVGLPDFMTSTKEIKDKTSGTKEQVVTDEYGNTYKVKDKTEGIDDLASGKISEASKNRNKNSNYGNDKTTVSNSVKPPNGVYEATPKHDPVYGWGSKNPIPNNEVGQNLLNNGYKVEGSKQVYTIYEGQIIKFQPDTTTGIMHPYIVGNTQKEVPKQIYEMMKKDGLITNAEYNKLTKNKWNK